jgi:hypothetical protein
MEITVGHERRLKALGLTAQWYIETFQRLGGKCERCGKPETKMHYGQPKPLVVDTSMNPPRLLCSKCNADKNTKNARGKEKAKAEAEEQRLANLTKEEFWNENRKSLSKKERERLEQRTEDILLLSAAMDDYVNGTDQTSQQDLLDTIEEVGEEVEKNGVCNLHTTLVEFWKPWEKNFFEAVVVQAGATETFIRYGYIDAIPGHVFHRFQQRFMQEPTINLTVKAEWVSLTCATPGCGQGLHAMPRELANEYAARGIKPFCYRCIDLERESAAEATIIPSHAGAAYDKFGRIKDFAQEER